MFRPVRITAPAELPVDITTLRNYLSAMDFTDDLLLIENLNQAATDYLDGWSGILGRCLISQEWRIDFRDFDGCRNLRLPFPDITAVAVKYYDAANVLQTVSVSLYQLLQDNRSPYLNFFNGFAYPAVYFDRLDAVQVTFTAGYGAANDVPGPLKQAIKILVAHWYEKRDSASLPVDFEKLIAPYRNRMM